jgi:hypothetical protein
MVTTISKTVYSVEMSATLSYNIFIRHIFLYTFLILDVLKLKFMVNKMWQRYLNKCRCCTPPIIYCPYKINVISTLETLASRACGVQTSPALTA